MFQTTSELKLSLSLRLSCWLTDVMDVTYAHARLPNLETKTMKPFTIIAIIIFDLVSIMHLIRLVLGWEVIVNGTVIPMWISGVAFPVAAALAFMLWREMHK